MSRSNAKRMRRRGAAVSGDTPLEATAAISNQPPAYGLRFEWTDISALRLSDRRLSLPNDRQHRQLMSSIQTFGFISPIVATSDGEVIVGERRLAAARDLKLSTVPVICADHLSPVQIRQYRIADNRLNELRRWDPDAFRDELKDIVLIEPEVDLEALGFEMPELDMALREHDADVDPADAILPNAPTKPQSQVGDVWALGEHLLGCGDARDAGFLASLMNEEEAEVVVTDPPFNVPVNGHVGGKGAVKHSEFVMGSGEMTPEIFEAFQAEWVERASACLMPGALLYIASDWRALATVFAAGRRASLELINLAVWSKPVPAMGSFYRSAHELFPVFRKSGKTHRNNIRLGAYGRNRSNCWTYPGAAGFGAGREALHLHPTPKPIALFADILLDCTSRGGLVLDPFSGSGTTLIAAQRTGRRARVADLDPRYVDVAIERFQTVFGIEARLLGQGLTLADLKAGARRKGAIAGEIVAPRPPTARKRQPRRSSR